MIAAASEAGGVVTNGMSSYLRDGVNANSALLVGVVPDDYGSEHPLAGIDWQRRWERLAFAAGGGGFRAPVQLLGDFLTGHMSRGSWPGGAHLQAGHGLRGPGHLPAAIRRSHHPGGHTLLRAPGAGLCHA